ncbi:FtsQ-type POTRA domain-containing protein [Romboutsia sp. CE17]|uniref:cell division protein FtsQ/DivIB n=1 Tax=Romboutsia sp. CE17 TaxID=2724150 RepID=UPI001442B34A|nr:FtsQ-type POTRA domain-containing protein [Romboutsia sp. CE17]QJA09278.1 FtsQ-type POTRA domain-containing protein [Romboutsia sp. CE17]
MKKRKRKRKRRKDKLIIVLTFILMVSLGAISLVKSNIFNLTKVEIIGNTTLKDDQIIDLEKLVTNKNIFTYNLKKVRKEIVNNPYIEDAQVKIKLPNKIVITVKEIDIVAVLFNGNEYCYIDSSGNLIEKINNLEENNDKIICSVDYTLSNNSITFKNQKEKDGMLKVLNIIKSEYLEKEVKQIEYTNEDEINIITKYGTKFLIVDDKELEYNIARASKILVDLQSKKINDGIVDLTYSNYAVYKPS